MLIYGLRQSVVLVLTITQLLVIAWVGIGAAMLLVVSLLLAVCCDNKPSSHGPDLDDPCS